MADRGDNQQREIWFDFLAGIQADRPRFMVEPRHASRMSGFYVRDGELNRMPLVKVQKNLGVDFVNEPIRGLHEWVKPDGNWEMLIAVKGDIYTWDYSGAPARINVLSGRGKVDTIATVNVDGTTSGADRVSFMLELLQGDDDAAANAVSNRWWGAPEAGVPDQFKLDADAETKWADIDYVAHHTRICLISNYAGTTGAGLAAAWSVRKCFGTTARVFFEDIKDGVLIWSDAGTRLFRWDGTTFAEFGQRTWQDFADSPTQGPQTWWVPVTEGAGSLTGKYMYRAVYVDEDGNYSAPTDESAAVTVTTAASIRHDDFRDKKYWPVGTETVRFYRTKALTVGSTDIAVVTQTEAEKFLNQGFFYRKDTATWYGASAGYHVHRDFSASEKAVLSGLIAQLDKGTGAWDINAVVGYCNTIMGFASASKPKSDWRTFLGHLEEIKAGTTVIGATDSASSYAFTVEFDVDDSGHWDDSVLDAGRDVSDTADAYESNLPPRHHVTSLTQFMGRLFYSVEHSDTPTDTLKYENYGETFGQDVQISGRVPDISPTAGVAEYHYGGTYAAPVGTDYQVVKALFVLNGELFAAKENGVWRLDVPSSDPADWGFVQQTNDANALNSAAVCVKGNAAFLLGKLNSKGRLWMFDGRRTYDIGTASSYIPSMYLDSTWTSMISWGDYLVLNQAQAVGQRGSYVVLLHEKSPGGIFEWVWLNACPMISSPKTDHIVGCDFNASSWPQVITLTEVTAPDDIPNGMGSSYIETPEADGGDPTVEKCWQSLWIELVNDNDVSSQSCQVIAYFDGTSKTIATYTVPESGKAFLQEFSLGNRKSKRVYFRFTFGAIGASANLSLRVYSAGVRYVPLRTAGRPTT